MYEVRSSMEWDFDVWPPQEQVISGVSPVFINELGAGELGCGSSNPTFQGEVSRGVQ